MSHLGINVSAKVLSDCNPITETHYAIDKVAFNTLRVIFVLTAY